jgi:hypothetical protein
MAGTQQPLGSDWLTVIDRRSFLRELSGGVRGVLRRSHGLIGLAGEPGGSPWLFWVEERPEPVRRSSDGVSSHPALDVLLELMAEAGMKLLRSDRDTTHTGPEGLIDSEDVLLIRVEWTAGRRGEREVRRILTGLMGRVLEHPDGYRGEVIILFDGASEGRVSPGETAGASHDPGMSGRHCKVPGLSGAWLPLPQGETRVSLVELGPLRGKTIPPDDHEENGYCVVGRSAFLRFTSRAGRRIEIPHGIWDEGSYKNRLKLIHIRLGPPLGAQGRGVKAILNPRAGLAMDVENGEIASGSLCLDSARLAPVLTLFRL